jgi:hypothetical protein
MDTAHARRWVDQPRIHFDGAAGSIYYTRAISSRPAVARFLESSLFGAIGVDGTAMV